MPASCSKTGVCESVHEPSDAPRCTNCWTAAGTVPIRTDTNVAIAPTIVAGIIPTNESRRATKLAQAEFLTPRSSLTAQGLLVTSASPASPASKLDFRWQSSNFEEWRPLVEFLSGDRRPVPLVFESSATIIGNVSGSISKPEMHGRLELGAFDFHGWRWDKLVASVIARPDFAAISSGSLERESSALSLEASAGLRNWHVT